MKGVRWPKEYDLFFESMGGYLSEVLQGQRLTAIFRSLQEAQQRRVFATIDH
jgi:hypothetical protein